MSIIRFGIIGCGLMGREFGSAVSRWCHLMNDISTPEIIGVSDISENAMAWFKNIKTVKYFVSDYKDLLNKTDIDAIYCAVPHHLHEKLYIDIINSKKHFLGEKPFGIDLQANEKILQAIKENPDVFVRCSSEYPFFPACHELIQWIKQKKPGRITEVRAGFNHSSDIDVNKPINWKRMVEYNGEYGCMGDLGIHTEHIPFRMGFIPKTVYAYLSKIVNERFDASGNKVPCKTWDNAMLICDTIDADGNQFPMYLETKRIKPGATNEWYIEVYGMDCAVKFSTAEPNIFHYTHKVGKEQAWCSVNIGYKTQIPTITGSIFEFGFCDSILQMWAAFILELEGKSIEFGCLRPEETFMSHILQTGALKSHKEKTVVDLSDLMKSQL